LNTSIRRSKRLLMKTLTRAALSLVLLITPAPSRACTIFYAARGAVVLAGNNEDWNDPDTRVWVVPPVAGPVVGVFPEPCRHVGPTPSCRGAGRRPSRGLRLWPVWLGDRSGGQSIRAMGAALTRTRVSAPRRTRRWS